MSVHQFYRHGQPGYYSLAELPQSPPIDKIAISTGWWEVDQIFKIYPGQFVMVTGIAGHGKSTFLQNVVCNVARLHGVRSFLYVPENEGHVRAKLRAIWGDGDGFRYFCSEQCFLQSAIQGAYDDAPHTLQWVLEKARIAIEKDDVRILVIDPWNELERAKPADMLLTDYIGQCLMWLKAFARVHQCTVILVAHPTKSSVTEGKTPTLADIEGSMNWYNKCDNGLIVVRDPDTPTARVISAKAREYGSGKRGACHFFVDAETGRFTPQHGAVG
jgi:twinkle protein